MLVMTAPSWNWSAAASLTIPLFIVTMASQNLPGLTVLRSQGYEPDVQKLFTITGLSSMAGAVGGGGLLSLAAITAALTAGPEAHPDPNKRYMATIVGGVAYILLGLASPLAAALIVAAPTAAIKAVAGLALMTSFAGALALSLQKPDERVAVIATFVVSASDISFLGVGASFWGLLVGGVLLVSETWRRNGAAGFVFAEDDYLSEGRRSRPFRARSHPSQQEARMAGSTERAVLAGGCFWGMQDLIRRFPGVISTRVGYTGGEVANATYRNHGNHAEAIEITFNPEEISYRKLLEFFFQIHDPSTRNRQGNDIGASYRSAIFFTTDEQKRVAVDTIADVEASGIWPGKVVTEVAPAGPFWQAEPEHQDYLERYPNGYTCHFVRPNWVLPRRAAAAE